MNFDMKATGKALLQRQTAYRRQSAQVNAQAQADVAAGMDIAMMAKVRIHLCSHGEVL